MCDALEQPQLRQLLSDSGVVIWDLNVIFRNSDFCSVSGKEKQFFSLIFFKIHQFCSAELLVLAVSACDLLVSPNTEHPTTLGPSVSSCCRVV